MTQTRKVKISVGNFILEAYQGEEGILFTHRQIGEAVGKTKEASQRYIKKRESELLPPIKVRIPERKGLIALTQWESAKVFWQYQAETGNTIAQNLIRAIAEYKVTDFPIIPLLPPVEVSNSVSNHLLGGSFEPSVAIPETSEPIPLGSIVPTQDIRDTQSTLVNNTATETQSTKVNNTSTEAQLPLVNNSTNEVKLIADGIEVASQWMLEAGIDEKAMASWKLKELAKQIPALQGVISSALEIITSNSNSPSGMIVSQLATELSGKMGTKVTPAKVNQALHDLELQDWAKPGVNRERKLTPSGQQYGVALLTTSADGWQGAQLRWYDSVIPLLCQFFDRS